MAAPTQTYPEALRALNKAVYDALRSKGAPASRGNADRQFLLELATKTDRMVDDIAEPIQTNGGKP